MPTALVTGATRGVGRGVSISLAASGFQVFPTGRSIAQASLPDSIVRIPCDHTRDEETDLAFHQVSEQAGALDVLVNCAWGGYEKMVEDGKFTWSLPFWQQSGHRWISMMDAGVRAAFACSVRAARLMVPRRQGLIVNISFCAAQKYVGNTIYGVAKAATDKMTADMAHELKPHGIAVLALYPGLVRTEAVLSAAQGGWLDISNSESPEFAGLVIAALAADPATISRTGRVLVAAAVAAEYDLADIDGRHPRPLTLETV